LRKKSWYEDGDEREGTVALIATDREGGTLKAYAVSSDKPTDAQTGERWTELSIDELQRARETKKCHNERLYLRRREEGRSTPPRRRDYPVRPSPDVDDKISAIERGFAEAGYVMEKPTEDPNALLHCLADNMPNAHAAQLRTQYKTKRAEILAYAQQHEDTYKRRVRIDAGAETEAKRTEAWQAWTQNITKLSHPLDELEADILGAMGHCLAIGMWNSSQKQPMLVIYSRGGGEKLIQIDAKQRPAEIEHFPVRLGQNYYARVTRRRATLNSFPVTAPAPPTNEDPTVIEDAAAPTLREERPGGDEVQSAASRTPNTALRARLNPEEEAEVAAAYRILQTFRLPAPATGPKRRKRHGRPTVADYFGTLDGEHQQQTGTTHAEAESEAPSNGGTSVDGARPRRNRLNAGLLRPATEGVADPAAAADQDVGSDRVDDPGDGGMGHDWGTGREDSEGRSGDRGCGGSAKREDSSDGSDGGSSGSGNNGSSGGGDCRGCDSGSGDSGGNDGSSGSSGGGDCGGSDSGGGGSGGSYGSSTERGDGFGASSGGSGISGGGGSGGSFGSSTEHGDGFGANSGGSGSSGGGDCGGSDSGGETGAAPSAETATVTAAAAAAAAVEAATAEAATVAEETGAALSAETVTVTVAATAAAAAEAATAEAAIAAACRKSGSAGTHNRAGGDGSSDDGDARDSNGERRGSSERGDSNKGRVGAASGRRSSGNESADASGGHISKTSEDKGHGGEIRRCLKHQRGAATTEDQESPTRRGSASDIGMMGQPPENYATRCDEAPTLHTNPAAPRAGAERDGEVESGETAATAAAASAAATKSTSSAKEKVRGKKRGGQQIRLSRHARKRNKKNFDKT